MEIWSSSRGTAFTLRGVAIALTFALAACAGGSSDTGERVASATVPESTASILSSPGSTIKIVTFNIQVFGKAKRENPDVMKVLGKIARKFDVMAIQEVRDGSETTVNAFLVEINQAPGAHYEAVTGPRLGRTSSKEQYAFIYNSDRVEYFESSSYTYDDRGDVFEREPFVARFRAGSFSFVLADIHTKPSDAAAEIDALDAVITDALHHFPGEKDVVALGDYNGDCDYFNPERGSSPLQAAKYLWIVPDDTDTTTSATTDCAYDRLVTLKSATSQDFNGRWGVIRFDQDYDLTPAETKKVSDHYPVWAEFKTTADTDGGPSS